jgi:hypothetical protein
MYPIGYDQDYLGIIFFFHLDKEYKILSTEFQYLFDWIKIYKKSNSGHNP